MQGRLREMQQLVTALESAGERVPRRTPQVAGRLPHLPSDPTELCNDLIHFTQVNGTVSILQRITTPVECIYDALDRLSAALWAALDLHTRRGWTYAEFFAAGQRQRAQVLGQTTDSLSGPGLPTRSWSSNDPVARSWIDPLQGSCPVCRALIPGGFFTGIRNRGVTGLKFKVGKPSDELRLRYGDQFFNQMQSDQVDSKLVLRLLGTRHSRRKVPSQRSNRPEHILRASPPPLRQQPMPKFKTVDSDSEGEQDPILLLSPPRRPNTRSNGFARRQVFDLAESSWSADDTGQNDDGDHEGGNDAENPIVLS